MADKPTAVDDVNKETAALLMTKMDSLVMKGPVSTAPQADVPERDDSEWEETESSDAVYQKYLNPVDKDGKPVPWGVSE